MPQSTRSHRPGRPGMAFLASVLFACLAAAPAAASGGSGATHSTSRSDADAYILALGDRTMSTNVSFDDHALLAKRSGDFLWFRRGGKAYRIEDRATLEEAGALFVPLRALEPEFEALRRKEEALNEQERELDRQDEDLDRRADQMTGDEGDEGGDGDAEYDEDVQPVVEASDADRAELQRELDEVRGQQRNLEARQRDLESDSRDLDAVERTLDAREDALEREAEGKLWTLIDDAVKKGIAKPSATP
jgi:hypothetical protein